MIAFIIILSFIAMIAVAMMIAIPLGRLLVNDEEWLRNYKASQRGRKD